MTQYLGNTGSSSGASLMIKSVMDALNQQKAQKMAMASDLIKSGTYQPTTQPVQPTNMLQSVLQSLTGPKLGGQNMSVMGQNFQMQTPESKMANLKAQLAQIQGMNGGGQQAQGTSSPMMNDASSGLPKNLPSYSVSPGDIDMNVGTVSPKVSMTTPLQQAEYQDKLLDIQSKQGKANDATAQQKEDAIYNQSPEDIKKSLMKTDPSVVRIGDRMINGGMSMKDLPAFGTNSALKLKVDKYIASQGMDEQSLAVRKKAKMDYSPGGSIGKQLISAGTIVQHLNRLKEAIGQLDNSNFVPKNKLGQAWAKETGMGNLSALRKYELMGQLLSEEYSKYMKGGAPAESGIERILNTMKESDPMDVQKQVLQEGADAMGGRLGRMVSGWYDVFNRPGDPKMPSTVLDPQTKQALKSMGMSEVIDNVESSQNTNPQQQGNSQGTGQPKYTVGQVIPMGNKKYRVTGGDPNDPDIEEVK